MALPLPSVSANRSRRAPKPPVSASTFRAHFSALLMATWFSSPALLDALSPSCWRPSLTTPPRLPTLMSKIRLLLLDDHALFRGALSRLLAAQSHFQVAAQCTPSARPHSALSR